MAIEQQKVIAPSGRPVSGESFAVQVPAGPVRFYQLRISSSGQVSALSPLPVPALPAHAALEGKQLLCPGHHEPPPSAKARRLNGNSV